MFANRFTALIDACALVPVLKRNLILSFADAGFFRVRWSNRILDEVERAIVKLAQTKGLDVPRERAARARRAMVTAFEDAIVDGYETLAGSFFNLPDPTDAHVIAAAVKTRASVIVTDNIAHFPPNILGPLDLEAKTTDAFLADTIGLDIGLATAAINTLRHRLKRPEKTANILLLDMEAAGLPQTVDMLRNHAASL